MICLLLFAHQTSIASATLFPVGWSVEDRIGWPVSQLHETVPLWQEKIGPSVERYIAIVHVDLGSLN